MFTQTFVDGKEKGAKPLALTFSFLLEALALCLVILIPLIYTETLPGAQLKNLLVAPGPPPAATPKPPVSKLQSTSTVRRLNTRELVAPVVVPNRVNPVTDAAPAPDIGVFAEQWRHRYRK